MHISVAIAVLFLITVQAVEHPVGTHGVTVNLPATWEQKIFAPQIEGTQFVNASQDIYCMVMEVEAHIDSKAAGARLIQTMTIGGDFSESLAEAPVTGMQAGDWYFVGQRAQGRGGSRNLAAAFGFVSRDGLSYYIAIWGLKAKAVACWIELSQMPGRMSWIAEGDPWHTLAEPVSGSTFIGGNEVSWSHRPQQLKELDQISRGDAFAGYASRDESLLVLLLQTQGDSLEGMTAESIAAIGDSIYREIARGDATLGGHPARKVTFTRSGADGSIVGYLELYVVAFPDGTGLDLRIVIPGSPHCWTTLIDTFLASVEILVGEAMADDGQTGAAGQDGEPWLRSWIDDAGGEIRPLAEPLHLLAAIPDGDGWIFLDNQSLRRCAADGTLTDLATWEDRHWLGSLARSGSTILCSRDGQVVPVGDALPAGLDQAILVIGDAASRLLFIAQDGTQPHPSLRDWRLPEPTVETHVRSWSADGVETLVSMEHQRCNGLAVSDRGTLALVLRAEHPLRRLTETIQSLRLITAAGETRSDQRWAQVRLVRGLAEGFLVTGTPVDGAPGIYRLTEDGERMLLVESATCTGLGLDADDLVALRTVWGSGSVLIRAPVSAWPRPPATVRADQIVALVQERPELFAETDDPLALLAAVRAGTGDLVWPGRPEEVDRLIQALATQCPLDGRVERLAEGLMTESLLAAGAALRPRRPEDSAVPEARPVVEGIFAVGINVRSLLLDALYNDEGFWSPLATVLGDRGGRRLVIGADAAATTAGVDEAVDADLVRAILAGDATAVEAIATLHGGNLLLRRATYARWQAAGRSDLVAALSGRVGGAEAREAIDATAWVLALPADAEEGEAGIDRALRAHPRSSSVHLAAGEWYRRHDGGSSRRARARFLQVIGLGAYGLEADQARTHLAEPAHDPNRPQVSTGEGAPAGPAAGGGESFVP